MMRLLSLVGSRHTNSLSASHTTVQWIAISCSTLQKLAVGFSSFFSNCVVLSIDLAWRCRLLRGGTCASAPFDRAISAPVVASRALFFSSGVVKVRVVCRVMWRPGSAMSLLSVLGLLPLALCVMELPVSTPAGLSVIFLNCRLNTARMRSSWVCSSVRMLWVS